MKCSFEYCIYNRNFDCTLAEPEINHLGVCDSCIIVSLNEDFLEKEKEKQLMELEKRWNKSIRKKQG